MIKSRYLTVGFLLLASVLIMWHLAGGKKKAVLEPDQSHLESQRLTVKTSDQDNTNSLQNDRDQRLKADSQLRDKANRVKELAETDPEAAFQFIESNYDPGQIREDVKASLLVILGERDLKNVERFFNRVSSNVRLSALQSIGRYWGKTDALSFQKWVAAHLDGVARNCALTGAIGSLIDQSQFIKAKDMLEAVPFSNQRIESIASLAARWGKEDIDSALEWAKALPLQEERDKALLKLAHSMKDRYGANGIADLVDNVSDPVYRRTLTSDIVDTFAESGQSEAAKKWVGSLPADVKQAAFFRLIDKFATSDLAGWSDYVLRNTDRQTRSDGVQVLVGKYFVNSPQDASKWVLTLPKEDKWTGISSLVSNWYGTDSEALSGWINQLPAGDDRDRALECLVYALRTSDVAAARDVVTKIGDKTLQKRVVTWLGN